jgi:hypothetical protein
VEAWSESWRDPTAWVEQLQDGLAVAGGFVRSGGPFDRWDLDLRAGVLGGVKIRTAVEEHGNGKQLLRARVWPRTTAAGRLTVLLLILFAVIAIRLGQPQIAIAIGVGATLLVTFGVEGMATATSLAVAEIEALEEKGAPEENAAAAAGSRSETRLGLAAMEERR